MAMDMATMDITKNSFRGAMVIFDKKDPRSRSSRTANNPSGYMPLKTCDYLVSEM